MEKIDPSKGFSEPLDFLEYLPNFHLAWQLISYQGLD